MIRIPQLSRTPLLNSSHPKFQSREAQILEGTVYEIWYARRAESQNPLSERQVQKRVQQLDQQLCFNAELRRSHGKQHERNPAENHGASCPCHPCRPRPSGRGAGQVEVTIHWYYPDATQSRLAVHEKSFEEPRSERQKMHCCPTSALQAGAILSEISRRFD